MADVVVVGSANVDLVLRLAHLPGPGETVTGGELTRAMGGKGANAAVAAARLGARVALVAAVGDDADGAAVRADLEGHGVDTAAVVTLGAPTGLAAVLVDAAGENAIAVASGSNLLLEGAAVRAGLGGAADAATVVVVDLEVGDAAVLAAAEHCARTGARLVLDPGPARPLPAAVIDAATVVTPNRGELAVLAGDGGAPGLLAAGAAAVAVTLGAGGVELHVPGGDPPVRIAPFAVDAVDSTGAGDAFAAGVAVALHDGRPLPDAVAFGAATGALATRAYGARDGLPDRAAVAALLNSDTKS
ncbi:MAG TPA: PfkB family carbohydrate kinase [Baekduia sp.]